MRRNEWVELRESHPDLFATAMKIEEQAAANGNFGRGGGGLYKGGLRNLSKEIEMSDADTVLEDRCHHGGCFT